MTTTHELHKGLDYPRFERRSQCISCGSKQFTPIWQAKFSDSSVQAFLEDFYYNTPLETLGEEDICRVQCQACQTTFHQRTLSADWLTRLYTEWITDAQITRFEAAHLTSKVTQRQFQSASYFMKQVLRLEKLTAQSQSPTPIRLLDYGCGDGVFLHLANAFGFETYGIDFSETRSHRASERGVQLMSGLEEFDAAAIAPLHVVTMFQVLEHLVDPAAVLRAFHDRMEPGGILVVDVPNCERITVPQTFGEFCAVQPLEHINTFTPKTLTQLCERHGFERIAMPPAQFSTQFVKAGGEFVRQLLPHRGQTNQYFRVRP